ncbi:hypothetical protein [Hyphomonas chukchiensis]|uniref:hypothetical protein n=1 Tax=Hyphomonas chukchiensis TaxID=1280947 RepID=UPI0030FBC16F
MEWIAAAIVYVGFLYKFPKATVISTVSILGLLIIVTASYFTWASHADSELKKRKALVSVEATMAQASCNESRPIAVTFRNGANRTLSSVSVDLYQPRMPKSYAPSQRVTLPNQILAKSETTWCFDIQKNFDGTSKLDLLENESVPTEIAQFSIQFVGN